MVTTSTGDAQPPRAPLGSWPTPLEPMPRLARALGLGADDLWVKRDDLIGLGGGMSSPDAIGPWPGFAVLAGWTAALTAA
ncbi:D-cysteine desulfhydrase family protein, partial [Streptomyces niveus]